MYSDSNETIRDIFSFKWDLRRDTQKLFLKFYESCKANVINENNLPFVLQRTNEDTTFIIFLTIFWKFLITLEKRRRNTFNVINKWEYEQPETSESLIMIHSFFKKKKKGKPFWFWWLLQTISKENYTTYSIKNLTSCQLVA